MSPETSRRGLKIKDETHDEVFSFTDGTHMLFVVLCEYIPNNGSTQSPRKQRSNADEHPVEFGKLQVIRRGQAATIIAVGPMLNDTLQATEDLDVTILYCTTVAPFDGETLRSECVSEHIVLVEPYYAGGLTADVIRAMQHRPVCLHAIGVPHEILSRYGTSEQHDEVPGLTPHGIRRRIVEFLAG
jgi:transketolase